MIRMRWLTLAALVPVIASANDELAKGSQDPNQWVLPLGSYSGIRHSKLAQITPGNASKLRVAWTMSTGTLRGQEGQPLVIGNMLYFESSYPNYVYAVNLDNVGQIVWKFAPEQDKFSPSVACCDLVNKGVSYADGKILVTTLDTHVYALDAKTGKVVWNVQNGDPQMGQTMTIAPLIVHDKVIVGISGGEYGVRGHLTAYDLKTGKTVDHGEMRLPAGRRVCAQNAATTGVDGTVYFVGAIEVGPNPANPLRRRDRLGTFITDLG